MTRTLPRPARCLAAALPIAALWLFSLAATAAAATPADPQPFCLPPVFEGGRRLHELPTPHLYWLELAVRQHELCWRRPPAPETRVALFGSSAVYGLPLRVEETLGERLNAQLAADGIAAHVFNLGWVNPYQIRDAVILDRILPFGPDVIVYPVTAAEFAHYAPLNYSTVTPFFESNAEAVRALSASPPPGLVEPFARYAAWLDRRPLPPRAWTRLRELGAFVRAAARGHADRWLPWLVPGLSRPPLPLRGRQTRYDCDEVLRKAARDFTDFEEWSILPYLQQLQDEQGIRVLVVNWPVAHEPVDDCYNVRFPNKLVARFNFWLATETAARGLAYLDLHDALPATAFFDSLHLDANGHAAVAERIYPALTPLLVP